MLGPICPPPEECSSQPQPPSAACGLDCLLLVSLMDLWSQLAQSKVDFNYSLQQHSSLELLMFGTQLESDGSSYAFLVVVHFCATRWQ